MNFVNKERATVVNLQVFHDYTCISLGSLSIRELKSLDNIMSYLVQGAFWARKKRPGWDGKKHLLSKVYADGKILRGYRFPTGLIHETRNVLPGAQCVYKYERTPEFDLPDKKKLNSFLRGGYKLRGYQRFAIHQMLKYRRGVVSMSTGGGKTISAAALLSFLNRRAVIMIPTLDILYQTRTKYAEYLGLNENDIGLIGAFYRKIYIYYRLIHLYDQVHESVDHTIEIRTHMISDIPTLASTR